MFLTVIFGANIEMFDTSTVIFRGGGKQQYLGQKSIFVWKFLKYIFETCIVFFKENLVIFRV